jgi:hypothetical protein
MGVFCLKSPARQFPVMIDSLPKNAVLLSEGRHVPKSRFAIPVRFNMRRWCHPDAVVMLMRVTRSEQI